MIFQGDSNLSYKMPSPLGQLQQLTISENGNEDNVAMSTNNSSTVQTPTQFTTNGLTMSRMPTTNVLMSSSLQASMSNSIIPTTLSTAMSTSAMSTMCDQMDDDVEMTRQKILADILSDEQKNIPDNFETMLNPIYFDFSS